MPRIELELDEKTLEHALQLAAARGCSVEELVKLMLEGMAAIEGGNQILGMMAGEPELMDAVLESAMRTRAERLQRQGRG
jgi:hypothetical protein